MDRTLVKGAALVTMDRNMGDLARGDILVEGDRIAAVGPQIDASDASVIDAAGMIVLPGLINGHLHTWQTGLRGIASDWSVSEYMTAMHRGLATLFKPDDIYIANLMGALNQMAHDLVNCAVMQAGPWNIDTVMIAGEMKKRNGKLSAVESIEKQAKLAASGQRIVSEFAAL